MAGIDDYTKLLLHCDGTDGSTTFTDDEYTPKTVTANGNAQIDTAQSKFGGASGLFDGTGDYLQCADHADYAFGSGDFTIDFWIRTSEIQNDHFLYDSRPTSTEGAYPMIRTIGEGGAGSHWAYNVNSTDVILSPSSSIGLDTWYHVAVARSSTSTKMFINGSQIGDTWSDNTTYLNGTNRPIMGASGYNLASGWYGWIDEFRVSKGIARWTANFTPPTEAYSKVAAGGFSGFSPWIFMRDMWEEHNKIFRPNKKILIPQGI